MNKPKNISKQSGLTLIEVLAALVILGIVFIGIMSVFPQMTSFNEKSDAKLDTMNLARQEMATFTKNDDTYPFEFPIETENLKLFIKTKLETQFLNEVITEVDLEPEPDPNPSNEDSFDYLIEKDGIEFHFQILINPDLGSGLTNEISLYRVILNVKSEDNTPKSKTYGYMEIKK